MVFAGIYCSINLNGMEPKMKQSYFMESIGKLEEETVKFVIQRKYYILKQIIIWLFSQIQIYFNFSNASTLIMHMPSHCFIIKLQCNIKCFPKDLLMIF